jgi:hypothetical protein
MKVSSVENDPLLATHERETLAQFEQKLLQLIIIILRRK